MSPVASPQFPQKVRVSSRISLSDFEVAVLDLFVSALRAVGLPKSLGEIYGLLFIAEKPQSFEDMAERLRLSRGSVVQGLKTLRQIGAVKLTPSTGRRDLYVAETELKKMVVGFIAAQVVPNLDMVGGRLKELRELFGRTESNPKERGETILEERLIKLEQWHRRASVLAPMVGTIIE